MAQTKVQLLQPDLGDVIDFDASTLFVDGADNRIGIRNTNPQYELDVTGTVRATNFIGAGSTTIADWIVHDGDTDTKIGFPAADKFQVFAGGGPRTTVTSTGLGIGTDSPSQPLHISRSSSGQAEFGMRLSYENTAGGGTVTNAAVYVTSTGLKFKNHNSSRHFYFETGNVAIGSTTVPTGTLELSRTNSTDMLTFREVGANALFAKIGYNSAGGTAILDIRSDGHMRFLTGGNNQQLRIDNTGVIETGTAIGGSGFDSNARLRVGRANDCNIAIRATGDTTSHTGIYFGDSASASSGYIQYMNNGDYMRFYTNGISGSEKLRITSDGCVYANNFGFGADNRWKIRPNTSNTELAFEYSTSSTLADTNIKMFLNPSGRVLVKTVPHATSGTMGDYGLMFQASTTPTDGQVIQGITFNPHDTSVGRARAGIAALANANGGSHPQSGADLVFLTRFSADGHDLDVATDERLRIKSDGEVLIGTTTDRPIAGQRFNSASGWGGSLQLEKANPGGSNNSGCPFFAITAWNGANEQYTGGISFNRSNNNTQGTHGAINTNQQLGNIAFNGSDGTNFIQGAEIFAIPEQTFATNDGPSALIFATVPAGTSETRPQERLRIRGNGDVVVGGGASVGTAGTFGMQSTGHVRTVLASGTAGDTLFGAISGVSNGFQINTAANNNQIYTFHNGSAIGLRISSDGKVGLGVDPVYSFQQIRSGAVEWVIGSSTAGSAALVFDGDANGDASGGDYSHIRHTTDGNMEYAARNGSGNAAHHMFKTNTTEQFRIHDDGIMGQPFGPCQHNGGSVSAIVNTTGRFKVGGNQFQTNYKQNTGTGWYTIAINSGGRSIGRIGIRETYSSRHQACVFYAAHHYGGSSNQNCINTIFSSGRHSGNPIGAIRIKAHGTYDGALLQVYLRDGTHGVTAYLLGDNKQDQGWIMKDWIADGTDPGGMSNWSAINSSGGVSAYSDMNEIQAGGASFDGHIIPGRDDQTDLGTSNYKFDDIYATNTTIIATSDERLKQDIASLTTAEMNAAKSMSALFKTFRWKDRVSEKGDKARTHTGVIAQQVKAALEAEGLDYTKYGFIGFNEWYEDSEGTKLPIETATREGDSVEEGTNATLGGNIVVPTGFEKKSLYSIRIGELLAFIAAYNEQRFSSIESRLTALES